MPSDTFFNPDPDERDSVLSDIFMNSRLNTDGDVWFDVIDESEQDTSWIIFHALAQDVSWSIFAETLYFIQQFCLKQICLEFGIKSGDIIEVPGDTLGNLFYLTTPVQYTFNIKEPITFQVGIAHVLSGEQATEDLG